MLDTYTTTIAEPYQLETAGGCMEEWDHIWDEEAAYFEVDDD